MDRGELSGIVQHSLLDLGPRAYFSPRTAAGYHGVSWFSGGAARKAAENGTLDIMPAYYRDIPGLFRDYLKPEAFVAVVSSMDRHGYFSTGCDSSITPALLQNAKLIFLEVNSNMPRSLASPQIHISQVTALWENHEPLVCLPPVKIDETSAKIGQYIAEEIPNGATLQLGIGAIPDAVGMALKEKRHLGIHTEMFTDSMVDLIACGTEGRDVRFPPGTAAGGGTGPVPAPVRRSGGVGKSALKFVKRVRRECTPCILSGLLFTAGLHAIPATSPPPHPAPRRASRSPASAWTAATGSQTARR